MNYWAHRGFSRLYPENTLTAFRAACEYDIAGIEFDVQLSADGELVVIHDETVDRTTDGTGEVRAMTLEELRALKIIAGFGMENAGRFERIPTMTEVLEVCAPYCRECGMMLDIELKTGNYEYPGIEEKALKAVQAFGLERCVLWSSFNPQTLERMRALDPGCRIAVISSDVETGLKAAGDLGCTELHPNLTRLKHYTETLRVPRHITVRAWNSQKVEPLFPAPAAAGDGYSGRADGPAEIPENDLTRAGASALITNNIDLYCEKRGLTPARLQVLAETQRLRKDSTVCAEDGLLEACAGVDVTPEPIRVEKGDRLEPTDESVPYSLFHYREEVPVGMILRHGARIESNWTAYTGEHDTEWRTEPYTFEQDGYVRIAFRGGPRIAVKKGVNAAYLDTLIRFRRAGRPRAVTAGEASVREAIRLDERLREQTAPDDLHLLLCADSHYAAGGTWDQTAQNLINVSRRLPLDGLIFLGDLTDGAQPHDETLRYAKHVLEDLEGLKLPLFMCIGDHDFNMLGPEKDHIDRRAAEKLYLGRAENLVIDFAAQRVRLIFAASFDPAQRSNPYGFSMSDQMWFSRAVSSAPKDHRIVVFSHVPPVTELQPRNETVRNGDKMLSVLEKQQAKRGNVLAWVCGHSHADQIFRKYSFPIVSIASMKIDFYEDGQGNVSTGRETPFGSAPERVFGEAGQECFDILTVSNTKNELRFLRFGAGEDRTV